MDPVGGWKSEKSKEMLVVCWSPGLPVHTAESGLRPLPPNHIEMPSASAAVPWFLRAKTYVQDLFCAAYFAKHAHLGNDVRIICTKVQIHYKENSV